jgi:hypothetical protein
MTSSLSRERCVACDASVGDAAHGLLCAGCAVGLVSDDVCPEQIRSDAVVGAGASNAFLVDGFGVPHALVVAPTVPGMPIAPTHNCRTVGRSSHCAVAIAERTVSLTHATFEYRPLSNAWFVVDAGSENGVFVNGDRVPRRFPLESRDRVMLGRRLGFVFVQLDVGDLEWAQETQRWYQQQSWSEDTVGDSSGNDGVVLRVSAVREGGAVARWGAEKVSFSELEYELLATLQRHHDDDVDVAADARGFVPASQLLEALSFRSEAPTHANLRGLVRKIRRKLADAEQALDVIESRQGLGYRLARRVVLD